MLFEKNKRYTVLDGHAHSFGGSGLITNAGTPQSTRGGFREWAILSGVPGGGDKASTVSQVNGPLRRMGLWQLNATFH